MRVLRHVAILAQRRAALGDAAVNRSAARHTLNLALDAAERYHLLHEANHAHCLTDIWATKSWTGMATLLLARTCQTCVGRTKSSTGAEARCSSQAPIYTNQQPSLFGTKRNAPIVFVVVLNTLLYTGSVHSCGGLYDISPTRY